MKLDRRSYGKPVLVRGVEFESCAAAAQALGVSRQRIQQIVREEKLRRTGPPPKWGRPGKPVTIGRITYPSIVDAAHSLGVRQQTIVNWQNRRPSRRHIRSIIFDLECLEGRVPAPFRDAIAAARRILLEQADLLDQARRSREGREG